MKMLSVSPSLTEQVYRAVLDEIMEGRLKPGSHLVQEQLAAQLGVSRQPIQQAMALLKADGIVEEVGKRGLRVASLDLGLMQCHYDMRLLLDGYAARRAAQSVKDGTIDPETLRAEFDEILAIGSEAIRADSVTDQIRYDQAFHKLIYDASRNRVLRDTAGPNWRYLRRVMAEVLMHAESAPTIWDQHLAIKDAILAGDPDKAGDLAEGHVRTAVDSLTKALERLRQEPEQVASVA
ncbi:MAG: GntR family transcriptional regulator [Pseudomonadota bacterium]